MPLWLQTRCGLDRRAVVALTAFLALAAVLAVQHFWAGRAEPVRVPEVVGAAASYGASDEGGRSRGGATVAGEPGTIGSVSGSMSGGGAGAGASAAGVGTEIVVDVTGKVRHPGIHRLPTGSRVDDALKAAGGVRPGTDITGLNRARFLVDGEQLAVGITAAVAAPVPGVPSGTGTAGGAGAAGGIGAAGAGVPAGPVSLNTATVEQLDTLPGVGPVLAQHIVDYRTEHGGFRSVDELRQVNGIGDRRFTDLRELVRP